MDGSSDNVFIGDLPGDVDEQTVRGLFSRCNVVSLKFMPPKAPLPGAKSAALVRFGSIEEAQWIVENINGNIPEGLSVPVIAKYAHSQPGGPDKGGGKGGGYGKADGGKSAFKGEHPYADTSGKGKGKNGKGGFKSSASTSDFFTLKGGLLEHNVLPGGKGPMPDANQLFVRGLPPNATDLDLYRLFGPFGAIPAKGIKVMTTPDGSCRGDAFVDFVEAADAQKAVDAISMTQMPEAFNITVSVKQPGKGKGHDKGKGKF